MKTENETTELLDLSFDHFEGNYLESRLRLCVCILENAASIKDWIVYQQYAAECRQRGSNRSAMRMKPACRMTRS